MYLKKIKSVFLPLLFCIISFILLLICSKCSPLYKFNDWVDINWFYTLGKGMFLGQIPYKDLFEQKGPFLYFIFGLSYLIKDGSIIGIFILEIISLSIYSIYAYKFLNRYLNKTPSFLGAVLSCIFIVTSFAFNKGGGSVEEFCLPFFMYATYKFFIYFEDKKRFTYFDLIKFGIILSIIFYSKFTILFYFIILLLLFIYFEIVYFKNKKKLILNLFFIFLGFNLISIPILIYLSINGAFNAFIECYFFTNIFSYSASKKFLLHLKDALGYFIIDFIPYLIIIYGLINYCKSKNHDKYLSYILMISIIPLFIFTILTSHFSYYFLILISFVPIGLVPLENKIISFFINKDNFKRNKKKYLFLYLILAVTVTFFGNNNLLDLINNKDYPQLKVANDIEKINLENPTLLCYKMQDLGFYRASHINPKTYYFALNNLTIEEKKDMYDSFDYYIENGITEFVIVFDTDYFNNKELFHLYCFINEYSYNYSKDIFSSEKLTFFLLKKI